MTLEQRVLAMANLVGADIKTLMLAKGDLTSLSTTAKTNLVAAINEIFVLASTAGATVNDASNASTADTWSITKIGSELTAAIASLRNELRAGAGAALDTFNEFAAAINNDASFGANIANQLTALNTAVGFRLRFDAAQTLTTPQMLQACANLGIGNPDYDFAAAYVTAKS